MGWAVQMKHEKKETTSKSHGFVRILNSKGNVLAEHSELQHNKNCGSRRELASKLAQQMGTVRHEEEHGMDNDRCQAPTKKKCPSGCCAVQ